LIAYRSISNTLPVTAFVSAAFIRLLRCSL
jgi:hypothetical protein